MWDRQECNIKGVLLGNESVHHEDIKVSRDILERFKAKLPAQENALDVAAGIGRVTQNLLTHYFKNTDLLEFSESLIKTAKENLKNIHLKRKGNRARNFYVKPM